jgi:hypothetical protein
LHDGSIEPGLAALGALNRVSGLGRHVVLVVLGQHFASDEDATLHVPLRDDTLAFLEQVGQQPFIAHGNGLGGVGDDEVDLQPITLDRAFLDQAADAERTARGGLVGLDLCRRVEKHHVALEGIEHQRGDGGHRQQGTSGQGQALVAQLHDFKPRSGTARSLLSAADTT